MADVRGGALRPRAGAGGKALLLTVLGELVLPTGGQAWTSTLVEAMDTVGITEKNARQALARLSDQGLIAGERSGRKVRWRLSPEGRAMLVEGTHRIYGFLSAPSGWDHQWLIVTFSVPEEQRVQRHHLRQRLAFAGFGFPGPGVAVCTHLDREALAVRTLSELGLDETAMVFTGRAGALAGDADLVRRAWDLSGLDGLYRRFLDRFSSLAPASDREAAGSLASLVHEWRRFPFVDPELPAALLPEGWPGLEAKALFDRQHGAWVDRGRHWFAGVDGR